ncbi:M56 family metallopeptidase [Mycetocola sp. CAN_C7]|uniref:M56 family metallopeptidase n=1 Tax=Mycetocola sp. CAN_C7 TaxID=2787724 RepID=UPI0018C91E3B
MLFASVALAALAVLLAWPVPLVVARASWPSRAPGTALVLWQAVALAGGLSMIGSLVTYGLIPFGSTIFEGLSQLVHYFFAGTLPPAANLAHIFALCLAVLLAGHLLLNLGLTLVRTERQRSRHLSLINLLSAPMPDRPGTRVLDHPAPVAYCLPGMSRSVTVLSEGLVTLLDADQLQAVIAHERAHLRQRHHLVLVAFKSWHTALPWFPIANRAETAVGLLVEMLADDQARRVVGDATLATAIALVASEGADRPEGSTLEGLHAGDTATGFASQRVKRLVDHQEPLSAAARASVFAAATLLLLAPTVLLVLI